MGAWGSGSFENDAALDWAASVQSIDDVRVPFARLKDLGAARVDADLACEVIAAAESVAMLMGRRSADFPDDLQQRLVDVGEPDGALYHQARDAVLHVLRNSELAELWEETVADAGTNDWLAAMTGLIDRLNPDIELEPWEPEEIEQKVGPATQDCAFCDRPVAADELFLITLYDATDKANFGTGLWLHLPCLNARLHHKHAIASFKFDPENLSDLDEL